VGAAAAPPAMGYLYGVWHSMAVAMLVPLACYIVVTHYAYIGSKARIPQLRAAAVEESSA
jgi:fucose permease